MRGFEEEDFCTNYSVELCRSEFATNVCEGGSVERCFVIYKKIYKKTLS